MRWLQIIQLIIAILLIASILMQNRGTGLSGLFGGGDNVYRAKRGFEKTLFTTTIILALLFFAFSLTSIIL